MGPVPHYSSPTCYKSRMNPKLTRQGIERLFFTNGIQGHPGLQRGTILPAWSYLSVNLSYFQERLFKWNSIF